MHRVCYKRIS
uniref:Uncharacterized protein n=1 Tax=Rhizophora mucronata TaxID=61149 RepID=A0A2P2R239_RHIMU